MKMFFRSFGILTFKYSNFIKFQTAITLIELIVSITIVSLIAGTFVPIFYNVTNSKLSEYTKDEMERIKLALLEFYRDCDQFPMDTNAISTDFLDLEMQPLTSDRYYGSIDTKTWRLNQWNGPYIQDKFNDNGYMKDAWQEDYVYDYTYGNSYCTVTSYGPNRASGGGDDITITANAVDIEKEKIKNVQDELDIIQKALNEYIKATGSAPSSISDLFEWEVLNLHMDEPESSWTGAANEVKDYSGMGNHGTAYNGANTTTGRVGRAGSFDGSNDYVRIEHSPELKPTEAITIAAWVYIPSLEGQYKWIVRTGWGGAPYFFGINHYNRVVLVINDKEALWNSNTAPLASIGWHHLVGTYDKNKIKIYIDGLDTGWTYSLTESINTNTLPVFIGGGDSNGDGIADAQFWYGLIDEVRIYKVVLSADEIHRHYENPGYPRDYFDLHDYTFKYDEWEKTYARGSTTAGGNTVYYFYSYGPDREDDSGADDDIKPRGL